ncbi:N-acyl homoserine lactonase family protein [Sphingobium subterraneum]|uniref:Glyoxylase-like metal-dependent hydrolase (Beta-lactamase superfamily II) n=1 Tax=Sphingobium subterraneum TaxID=627688 RepID=A0A841IUD5_9SPHN|nr:N-acyl homoserine lactonase family protein [Sphingobium subterraneum]MBB6122297.1 glyoxylase-like metal-dependent hydrolase (beta-lactamase superfamily II) [Sphingobium subterraneum]
MKVLRAFRWGLTAGYCVIAALALGIGYFWTPAFAGSPRIHMWRLDCGSFNVATNAFSDTFAYPGERRTFADNCYLIQHGKDLMLWDAGYPTSYLGKDLNTSEPLSAALRIPIVDQIKKLGFKASDVSILGLSHDHIDHTGQAGSFPDARLLLGKEDIERLKQQEPPFYVDPSPLAHWLKGGGKLDPVEGDRDVFGDGSVIMIALPGHTPGNHGLLVRLSPSKNVVLSGDAVHFHGQQGIPPVNVDRAQTLASLNRIEGLVRQGAKLIIQHDPADQKPFDDYVK